jgi:hypothetical protein
MKKNVICVGVCCLLLLSPIALCASIQKTDPSKQIMPLNQPIITSDEPPTWAKGNFSGVWGVTVLGAPLPPLGWIQGYYQNIGFGKLDAVYADFNHTNATSYLRGFMLWIFFFGGAGNLAGGNTTWVSGIGVANNSSYYCRINALIGPSFYILVNYTAFGNQTTTFQRNHQFRYSNERLAHVLNL